IAEHFPPGVLQGDPRYTHVYFDMSNGKEIRGPWNQGQGPWQKGEEWQFVGDPIRHVQQTQGLVNQEIAGDSHDFKQVETLNRKKALTRSGEVTASVKPGEGQWSTYPERTRTSKK
ncbi:MAG TPA: hypothetical protein VN428_02255, partial [Bryobacteraceae bacterium]|nr:hypothetical protein [Bryobacteraceae bacterium]